MASISAKFVMALSGLFLIGFLAMHLLGNLQIFSGPEAFNGYSETLHHYRAPLWVARILLIAAFASHICASIYLSARNSQARPVRYQMKKNVKASLASRTMLLGGLVILSFLLFHLAHLTWRWIFPEFAQLDLYSYTVLSFQNGYIVLLYILAQLFLALHLSHGFVSAAQTLSLTRWHGQLLYRAGLLISGAFAVGYLSIPLSIWLGFIHA